MKEYARNPLVTVVVPNYNHARYLELRLDSVFNQTYQNFEVIILDDCSTDNSLEIIEKYKGNPHLSRIVVNETNTGSPFKQWNKGIGLANGELVWIAESDDYCELNMLEELVKAYLTKPDTVLVYSTTIIRDDEGNEWNEIYVGRNQYMSGKRYLRSYLALHNFVLNASCVLFRKEQALSVPKDYQSFKGAGDYLFWTEIVAQGNVAIVNKRLSYFCRHAGTVTSKRGSDGTNQREDMVVLKRICSLVHISSMRLRYVYAFHSNRIQGYEYTTSEIKNEIWQLWGVDKHNTKMDRLMLRVGRYLRKHYNYYI